MNKSNRPGSSINTKRVVRNMETDPAACKRHWEQMLSDTRLRLANPGWAGSRNGTYRRELEIAERKLARLAQGLPVTIDFTESYGPRH